MLVKAMLLVLFSAGFLSIGFYNYYYASQRYNIKSPLPYTAHQVLAAEIKSSTPSQSDISGLVFLTKEAQFNSIEIFSTPTLTPTLTPTPSPTPTQTPTSTPTSTPVPINAPVDLESLFSKYSGEYSVDKELLKRIAQCESHTNSGAINDDYGGMYQFATSSWISTRAAMGQNTDESLRFNAQESIKTAAYKISKGGIGAWPNCSK